VVLQGSQHDVSLPKMVLCRGALPFINDNIHHFKGVGGGEGGVRSFIRFQYALDMNESNYYSILRGLQNYTRARFQH
jgi:hypothetical protein